MSVYLYGFKTRPNSTPVHDASGGPEKRIDIFELAFKMGSLGRTREDDIRYGRISTAIERAWEGKAYPEYFTVGKRKDGREVYQTRSQMDHAEWVDTGTLPGDAVRVGNLRKTGKGGAYLVSKRWGGRNAIILAKKATPPSAQVAHVMKLRDDVERYLPDNYRAYEDGRYVTIRGGDRLGWTLDDYVIPRLRSGLMLAVETTVGSSNMPPTRKRY